MEQYIGMLSESESESMTRQIRLEITLTVINAGHASIATVIQVVVIIASTPEKSEVVMWKYVIRQWQEKD